MNKKQLVSIAAKTDAQLESSILSAIDTLENFSGNPVVVSGIDELLSALRAEQKCRPDMVNPADLYTVESLYTWHTENFGEMPYDVQANYGSVKQHCMYEYDAVKRAKNMPEMEDS